MDGSAGVDGNLAGIARLWISALEGICGAASRASEWRHGSTTNFRSIGQKDPPTGGGGGPQFALQNKLLGAVAGPVATFAATRISRGIEIWRTKRCGEIRSACLG